LSILTTDQKGAIAETAIIHAAVKLGIGVYKPLADGDRYDLIFDLGTKARACSVQVGGTTRGRRGRALQHVPKNPERASSSGVYPR